jgi:hypothetical protein
MCEVKFGSTAYDYDNSPYDKDYDAGYDYFLIFVLFLIMWWFVLRID